MRRDVVVDEEGVGVADRGRFRALLASKVVLLMTTPSLSNTDREFAEGTVGNDMSSVLMMATQI